MGRKEQGFTSESSVTGLVWTVKMWTDMDVNPLLIYYKSLWPRDLRRRIGVLNLVAKAWIAVSIAHKVEIWTIS